VADRSLRRRKGEATLRELGRSGLLVTAALALVVALTVAAGSSGATLAVTALQFNGTSQYVRAGSVASSPDALNATRFTLETWFYRTGTGATTSTGTGGVTAAPLIAKGRSQSDGSNVDLNYFLGIDSSGRLAADFEEGAGQPSPGLNHPVTGSAVITNNAWHHAAVTYDGRTWKLYLDGRLDRTLTLASPLSPRSDSIQRTALGSALNSSGTAAGFFRGRMDEARIWNVARTGQQIRQWRDDQITGPQTGLLARFGMGEGSGTTVANSAGSPSGVLRPSGAGPTWIGGYTFPQDTTAPSAPASLSAAPGTGTVTLSWTASAAADLAGYDLYRSTSLPVTTTGGPVNGADLLTGSSYTDTGLVNGTTYHYAIRAVDRSDNASALSAPASATPSGGSPDPVLLVAGDIAGCTWSGDENTASVVNGLAGTVVTLGDNVYPNGTLTEFTSCYAPSWGQFKARTRPTPGNHDYNTPGATGYFDYFNGAGNQTGPAGDRSRGYYSFDLGTWHIVVLNSECETTTGLWLKGGCAAGSAQETWFKADLAAATTNNVIVTWHKPRYSSSTEHGNSSHMQALWKVAYDRGVDLMLAGHSHNYERFAPMNASGAVDATFGMRELVVGTGGASYHGFTTPAATSEVRNTGTHGVLKLTLHASSYEWQFVPVAGKTFADAGTQAVHGPPPA
jgi:hypothetical protein